MGYRYSYYQSIPIFTHIMSTTTCVNERLPLKNTEEESIPWNDDDLATKKKMKQKKTGYGIISLSVVAALFLVVALKTDTFNIVSNMDGSSKSTQKPNKRKGATLEVFSLLRTSDD